MKVTVNRLLQTSLSTISTVEVNNMLRFYGMETPQPIPAGTYPLIPYNSPTHGRVAMLGGKMAGRYIEIHVGNYPKDTKNCLLLGSGYMQKDFISASKIAVDAFTREFNQAYQRGENCTITYKDYY